MNGHPEAFRINAKCFGNEFPRHSDGAFFEIVAKTEVAKHLEEGAVTRCRSHYVDINCSKALLDRRGRRPRGRLIAKEVGLEGNHSCDREQNARVVRNQTRRGDNFVSTLSEELQEGATKRDGIHRSMLPGRLLLFVVTRQAPLAL